MVATKKGSVDNSHLDATPSKILDDCTEKIMRVLIENPAVPYNKSSLAEAAGISRDALYSRWEELEKKEVIMEAKVEGKADYYRLNPDSEIVDSISRILYLRE